MRSRYEGIQNYVMSARDSCFFLSLLSVAEEERDRRGVRNPQLDFLDSIRKCIDKKYIGYDYFVRDDCAILTLLTGFKCTKEVVQEVGIVKANQYTIEKWVRGDKTHFRRRGWDVYKNSDTVRYGYRMCTYKYTFED